MKNAETECLWAKYRDGDLADEERLRLELLTRKEDVLAEAERRAALMVRMRRRRVTMAATLATVFIAGGVILMHPSEKKESVAMQQMPQQTVSISLQEASEVAVQEERVDMPLAVAERKREPKIQTATPSSTSREKEKTVVLCNSQCDADSVISDIWKFLSV